MTMIAVRTPVVLNSQWLFATVLQTDRANRDLPRRTTAPNMSTPLERPAFAQRWSLASPLPDAAGTPRPPCELPEKRQELIGEKDPPPGFQNRPL
jgi:hypothetical protein